jgi:ATP-binding protein involved in chromosome partitioning
MITKKDVLDALSHVDDPDLQKDLVTLGMIREIEIGDQSISFEVVLTTPACPLKDHIQNACINAIHHFIGKDWEVKPVMTSNVQTVNQTEVLKGVKNVIAVASGKGGVGKSSTALEIALILKEAGAAVGVLDADVYGPSIPTMLGLSGSRPESRNEKLQPVEKDGMKVMSIGFLIDPNQAVVWRGPMASSAIKQFVTDVNWGELDYLIVDLPPGTGDIHLTVLQSLPVTGVVMVTTPQEVAVADCRKAIGMFNMKGLETPILGLVENMAWFTPAELPDHRYPIFGEGGGEQLSTEFDIPLLGQIPLVMEMGKAADTDLNMESLKLAGLYGPLSDMVGNLVRHIAIAQQEAAVANQTNT